MIFNNAKIFTNQNEFRLGSLKVFDSKISEINFNSDNSNEDCVDCKGLFLIPGLVDIHFHGCNGHDFCEGTVEAIDAISTYEINHGITSICPATMTFTEEILTPIMQTAANYNNECGSRLVGINMEGPFISPDKVGAQNPEYVQSPDFEMLCRLQKAACGLIKLVDVAPEVKGAKDFIKAACNDFCISVAHTCTSYQDAHDAYKNGAKHLTHTFNAMPPIHHRNPGPIPAAAECGASAEIICDGLHIHYSVIRLAFELFKDKLCLISDTCEATGLEDGQYSLGGQPIIKTGNKVVLKEDSSTIAGSATNLFDCLKHAIFDAGINMEKAICAATINPAKAIGVDDMVGSIEVGKYADFLLVDDKFNIINVFKCGKDIK